MARTWVTIESSTRDSYAAGSRSRSAAAASRREARRDVSHPQVVRGCLIGEHVGHDAPPHELRQHLRDVPDESHRERAPPRARVLDQPKRRVEVVLEPVAVAGLHPPPDAALVHVHTQKRRAVHRGGERLRSAHPAEPARDDQPPLERAAEMLPRALGEGLVRALQDSLRPDVDPRARGHLAVHGEPERVQPAELVPGGPARHQVRVGDEHPRAPPRESGTPRPACRSAPAGSRRSPAGAASRRSARSTPSCAPPCPPRRRRSAPPAARPPRGRGCS